MLAQLPVNLQFLAMCLWVSLDVSGDGCDRDVLRGLHTLNAGRGCEEPHR